MISHDLMIASPGVPGLKELLKNNGVYWGLLDVGFVMINRDTGLAEGAYVFNDRDADNIELSVYFGCVIPVTRNIIRTVFAYPFLQLGVGRVTARTRAGNLDVRKKIRRLGFKPEGRLRQYFPDDDAMLYGMLRDECRWIN